MKKILFGFIATVLMSNITFSQSTLMSDNEYRSIILNFSQNLNNVLLTECPQEIDLFQFKKKIISGEIQLSNTAKSSIYQHASLLITYARDFKDSKNLTSTNDAEIYILSSFAPSTTIINGKLIETSITKLKAIEMWNCALSVFNTDNYELKALVSDNVDVSLISKATATYLTQYAGNTGVWIMISEFSNCLDEYNNKISSNNVLTLDDIKIVSDNIINYQLQNNISSIDLIPEADLKVVLTPLINNGKTLHTEMLISVSQINAFKSLTIEQQEEISNISDEQAVVISVIFASNNVENKIDWPTVFACGAVALGIEGAQQIYNLLIGAGIEALGLGTVLTAIGTVASHYIGIFAVAVFVYDFVSCLN